MRFEELRIRGFLSFGPKEQVVPLGKRGLVLIEGENRDDPTVDNNGSGKSSISEALLWGLFGQTVRGVSGDAVVNRRVNDGCKVTVTFTNDAGQTFKVERYRKDPKEKNRLVFTGPTGGLTANETSITEAKVREALGMDFDTFTSAVVFGQGQSKHFASMTDKEMKRITDKLIGVEVLTEAHKRANEDLKAVQAELTALASKLVDEAALKQALRDAKADAEEWEKEHAQALIDYERQVLAAKPPDLTALKAEETKLTVRLRAREATYDAARSRAEKATTQATLATDAVRRASAAFDAVLDSEGECGHCGQVVTGKALEAHREDLRVALGTSESGLAIANDVVKRAAADKAEAAKARDAAALEASEALDALNKAKASSGKAEALAKAMDTLSKQTNPHAKAVTRASGALDLAKTNNEMVDKAAATLEKRRDQLGFIVAMFSDKGGPGLPPLKGLLVESVAPFVNQRLAHYGRILTDGNIAITFETQTQLKTGEYRETYGLKAVNRHGADAYEAASGGERRKIDAAVFFAFQALAASRAREQVRFAVWDEVFDALDETAQEVMMELLLDEKKRKDTVFVITQRPELRASFPATLKVVKVKGYSSIA